MGEKMEKRQKDFCMGCMNPLDGDRHCICGFSIDGYKVSTRCLPPGTVLTERYLVGRMIGEGSFGVTYIGRDLLLGIIVAIKEYFPLSYGSRDARKGEQVIYIYQDNDKKGLEHFYREAKLLSQFHMLDGIVSVRDFFYANETAYIVMDYIKGITLKEHVKKNGAVEGKEALAMIRPVIRSLHIVHQADIIHRDISPDNIMLSRQWKAILIDFGAAKDYANSMKAPIQLKYGYAPVEQYDREGNQGPWTDVYSMCASIYYLLTGVRIQEARERQQQDNVQRLQAMGVPVSEAQDAAIWKGLCIMPEERYQSAAELYRDLYQESI